MFRAQRWTCLLAMFCLFVFSAASTLAQEDEKHAHHHDAAEKLGKVSFPISCAASSQKPFERGVALLHSFGYEEAGEQFENILKSDPKCAMAHWGVAMSLYHQIWERPTDATMKRGHEELAKAQQAGAKTERERGYISALSSFYAEPSGKDYLKHAEAYSDAMGKLYQKYPDDLEAGTFYALSLLASASPDDTSLSAERKAVAVLNPIFEKEPEHPGVAHYIIHSCDSPQLAGLGLNAARRYAAIAPSSAHAVHMPSHIFARLGLWQEDIQANLKSVALAHPSGHMYMHGHELHAMDFLIYAYLQTGQEQKAKAILNESKQIVATPPMKGDDMGMLEYFGIAAARFPATYYLEMHDWKGASQLQPAANAAPHLKMITYWAQTVAYARLGDVENARKSARLFDEAEDATRKSRFAYIVEGPNTLRGETHAWLAFAEKKSDEAVREMRAVADRQDKVGKGEVEIPAREMLADMMLELQRPADALAEYELSMKTDPGRFNGLAGAAQSAKLAHQTEKANSYYAQLLKNCDEGKHSARPELRNAKMVIAGGVQ